MGRLVLCAATIHAGVRHRYVMLRQVKAYADRYGYKVRMLWGITGAVANHRHEELFAPVPGVEIRNISRGEVKAIKDFCQRDGGFRYDGEPFYMLRTGQGQGERFFSWDLAGSGNLALLVPRPFPQLVARPSAPLRAEIDAYVKANRVQERLGIRVRAMELPNQKNRIHRNQAELDGVLHALYRIPWYVPVFIVTDSEYVQQILASHFVDSAFLPKKFDEVESSGRYVDRDDKDAMKTFIKEIDVLCACKKIISYGGFLNDCSVDSKIIEEPYNETAYMNVARA
jgi:ribonuclease HI